MTVRVVCRRRMGWRLAGVVGLVGLVAVVVDVRGTDLWVDS